MGDYKRDNTNMKEEIARFQNVSMSANGEIYLDNLNFYMLKGEIMGLIASRGKGRDEFIGLLQKNSVVDYGRIFINGKQVNSYLHSSGDWNKVYVIGKKSSLIEGLSVTDNIFVIRKGFKKFIINDQVLKGQIKRLAEELGVYIHLDKNINQFTPLERCEAEILKAYMIGCELVVLIDLSEFMGQRELLQFYERMERLKKMGLSFLYVCNHHEEAFKISDRVSLYSNGRIKKVFEKTEMTEAAIAPYIMDFDTYPSKTQQTGGRKKLEFKEIESRHLKHFSFHINEGECLTILDMDNTSTEEIARIFTGEEPVLSGEILYNGLPYEPQKEKDFLKNGIAVIPENPTQTYLFTEQTYMENLTFLLDKKLGRSILKKAYLKSIRKEYEELARGCIDEQDIRRLDPRRQYELVYYRVLLYRPQLAILIQPVAHGDMLCRRRVLDLIQTLKDSGITVLITASSISDNLYVSDRLLVIKNKQAMIELEAGEFDLITR